MISSPHDGQRDLPFSAEPENKDEDHPPAIAIAIANDTELFFDLFSESALRETFSEHFASSTGKGIDRLNGHQFSISAQSQLLSASEKCLNGTYKFSPFLEVLKTKGRSKNPRLIGIPTVRDRVVLNQLNRFLSTLYPDRIPSSVASKYVREIISDLKKSTLTSTWVCNTDIKTFYDSVKRDRLLLILSKRVKCEPALRLLSHALATPTVPKNTRKSKQKEYRTDRGIPQGLAISNILASIYMEDVDTSMQTLGITYVRYVDDVLMYGDRRDVVETAFKSLRSRLAYRGLSLHPLGSGKSSIQRLDESFSYLGYVFKLPHITVRESTTERFLQSIAAKFSDYSHNRARRLEKFSHLTPDRLREIFILELNERVTGAISEKKRYGWIAYFNQITDLTLLHHLDNAIAKMFSRLHDFDRKAPKNLKTLRRAYYEMKFNPQGGYVRDYDRITTVTEMLALLQERGRIRPGDTLNDEEIKVRYEKYRRRTLAAMHKDEGSLYG